MKTIIAGSRSIASVAVVKDAIKRCDWTITEVVCGMCAGGDLLGKAWAERNGIPVTKFPADWLTHGKAAGPIRNTAMANYAEALLAIRYNASRGTSDMIRKAIARKLEVLVLDYTDDLTPPVRTRYRA